MKVLVTGSNGFLGSHIVRVLIDRQYEVKAFILKGTSVQNLEGLDYELFEGDLLNREDISSALESCDYVIHAAAITDISPTKNPLSWKINYDVVQMLVEEIRIKNIKRLIHIGTANSFGFGSIDVPGNETTVFNCGKYGLDYINSKKAAQDYLLEECKKGLDVVIINPTFMIGENDVKPGTGEMIISVMMNKIPGYTKGGRCFAAVKDVSVAAVNAITKGKKGECYITGGVNLCYKDFFTLIGDLTKRKIPKRKIPTFLTVALATIMEAISVISKKTPKLTRAMAKISGEGNYYSSEKAMKELGYPQTDLKIALNEAISWYQEHDYVS